MSSDLETAVAPVADALDRLGVDYYLAGSVISSLFGIARATADVDVVADLRVEHAVPLVAAPSSTYYVDEDAVADAVKRRAIDRSAMTRRLRDSLTPDAPIREFSIATAEDVVLHKLRWFRDGGEVSDR